MKGRRVLDFVAYVTIAVMLVATIMGMAVWRVPKPIAKGVATGLMSGLVVFTLLIQQFPRRHHQIIFWAALMSAAAMHLLLFAAVGTRVSIYLIVYLVTPAEFAILIALVNALPVPHVSHRRQ